jgi:hypothetical protein
MSSRSSYTPIPELDTPAYLRKDAAAGSGDYS